MGEDAVSRPHVKLELKQTACLRHRQTHPLDDSFKCNSQSFCAGSNALTYHACPWGITIPTAVNFTT